MSAAPSFLSVTAVTHTGLIRDHNEDTLAAGNWVRNEPMSGVERVVLSLHQPVACLVADGMGGHAAGEAASFYAAARFTQAAHHLAGPPAVAGCLQEISNEIQAQMERFPERQGMGTTIAGLLFSADSVCCFNVGDSRVYQVRTGFLRQLSVDHVPQQPAGQVFEPEPAPGRGSKSGRLLQFLGGMREPLRIAPSTASLPLQPGAVYLVCSDGLTDMVGVDGLEACLVGEDATAVAGMLQSALVAGGHDNITIMLIRVGAGDVNA